MSRSNTKMVLVTRGSRSLGVACVQRLVGTGARAMVMDMLDAPGRQLVGELGDHPRDLHADVTVETESLAASW